MKPIWNRVKNHIKRNAEENFETVRLDYGEYHCKVHINEWTTDREWTFREIRVNGFGLRSRNFYNSKEFISGVPYYPFHYQPETREEQIRRLVDDIKIRSRPYSRASKGTIETVESVLQSDDPAYPEPEVYPRQELQTLGELVEQADD